MKKRYGLLAGLLILSALAVGCGKKDDSGEDAAPTPTPTIETSGQGDGNIVSMEQSSGTDKSRITKIMGEKTATSADLVIVNNTGLEIESFYVRPNGEEDWSDDYIDGKFTLKAQEKALYYYDPSETDENGGKITRYDLRVSYADEDESDCLFRNLTLSDIEELKLNMEDGVPFVTYISLSTKRQISTLEDAKARMGRTDDGEDVEESSGSQTDSDSDAQDSNSSSTDQNTSSEPADDGQNEASSPDNDEEPGGAGDTGESSGNDSRSTAEGYVGQPFGDLEGAIGSSSDADFEQSSEDSDSEVWYYYYDGFTVTTEVDEDGNETVTGVW